MIEKNDLIAIARVATVGCITSTQRMLKLLFSEAEKKIFVVGYFDDIPRGFEKELVSDVSGEISCSLIDSRYECLSVCVYTPDLVVGNTNVKKFESELCESISFSNVLHLRFGEEGGFDDLTSDCYLPLDEEEFFRLEETLLKRKDPRIPGGRNTQREISRRRLD